MLRQSDSLAEGGREDAKKDLSVGEFDKQVDHNM